MALREEFRANGNWLFHYRSYLPLLFLPVIIMETFLKTRQHYQPDHLWGWICLALSMFGLAIRIFTVGYVPRGTSGRNFTKQIANVLNTSGIYSITRHPLYLGNFFMWFGVVLFVHSWSLALIFILMFWLYYERIMYAEEEFLREKFGAVYTEWANKTPAFLPNFSKWQPPNFPFSLRTVLKREYYGLAGIIFIFSILQILNNFLIYNELELSGPWVVIFNGNILLYIIIGLLDKKTRIFHVEGR